MARDLYSNTSSVQSLAPAARTASANGTGVDLHGFQSALIAVHVGAYTDGTHTFEVQESADNATFAAVDAADLQGAALELDSAGQAGKVHEMGYYGSKRYLRVAVTVAGATAGALYGAAIVRGHPNVGPTR